MILKKYMDTKERMKIAHNLSVITNNNTTHAGRGNHDGVIVVPVKKFPDNLIYNLFRKRLDMEKYWSKKMISFTAVPSEEYRQEFYEGNNIIELLETMKKKDEGIEIQPIRIPDKSVEELHFFSIGDVTTALQNLHSVKHWMLSGSDFKISPFSNHNLLSIILISCGNLSADTIKNLCMSNLTSLYHLELWIGEMHNWSSDNLAHLLSPEENGQFPMLQYLGLRNGERISQLCDAIVQSSIAKRVRVIDLSLGLLNDTGASILLKLGDPELQSLEVLNIHHNSISDTSITQKLQNELKCFVDVRFINNQYIAFLPH